MAVSGRIGFVSLLALNRLLDLLGGDCPFFHNSVGDNRRPGPMEEVQNPKMHVLNADTKFIDPVP